MCQPNSELKEHNVLNECIPDSSHCENKCSVEVKQEKIIKFLKKDEVKL